MCGTRSRASPTPRPRAWYGSLGKKDTASPRKGGHPLTLPARCRGLEFTCIALSQNLANHDHELSESFRNAYGVTLKPHHSFLVKPVFSAAMGACPYRKDFYTKLGSDEEKVKEELREYLAALDKIVAILKAFLDSPDAKW